MPGTVKLAENPQLGELTVPKRRFTVIILEWTC